MTQLSDLADSLDEDDQHAMQVAVRIGYKNTRRLLDNLGLREWSSIIAGRNQMIDVESRAHVADAPRLLDGKHVACRAGCAACCYQTVKITSTEGFFIASTARFAPVERARIDAVAERARGLDVGQRYKALFPCSLLDPKTNRCGIYAVRPEPCRTHFSLSKLACQGPGEGKVPLLGKPKIFGHCVTIGSDYALLQRGLQMARMELSAMLVQCLRPGALDRWLIGERVIDTSDDDDYTDVLRMIAHNVGLDNGQETPTKT